MAETCLIIGSAPMTDAPQTDHPIASSYLICADGGLDFALRHGLKPDLVVGDFDSAHIEPPEGLETIRLPVDKDDTDLLFAVKEGFRRGYRAFHILGALGARLDHSYANFCVLQYIAGQGGRGVLEDGDTWMTLLHSGGAVLTLEGRQGCTVSVFPFGTDSCTLSYTGMRYPLSHGTLRSWEPVGVSNVVEQPRAEIILHEGTALVMLMKNVRA